MGRWIDGWMGGWMDGRVDGWAFGSQSVDPKPVASAQLGNQLASNVDSHAWLDLTQKLLEQDWWSML
jgi:hypothetical protein